MSHKIADAKDRMTEYNNFTFEGDSAALEVGHVLNMVNQLNTVLFEIRKECFNYQCEHMVSEFRKCSYCGLVWIKKESGNTTCGNADSTVGDTENGKYAVFGSFSFSWERDELTIQKKQNVDMSNSSSRPMSCCGKTINWEDMETVEPDKFSDVNRLFSTGIKMDSSRERRIRTENRSGEMATEFQTQNQLCLCTTL